MDMVKNIACTLFLVAIVVAATLVPAASGASEKSIEGMDSSIKKAFDAVIAAAPASKRSAVESFVLKQKVAATASLNEAAGDKMKVDEIVTAYKTASEAVLAAKPADRYAVFDKTFSEAGHPPTVKAVDALEYSFKEAIGDVVAAAPAPQQDEMKALVFQQTVVAANMLAQSAKDKKVFAAVTTAYKVASDAVLAAAPADKYSVMEKTFAEAADVKAA
ncbi:uncharacterized protein OsI_031781-like [Triticum dicoccoides]|uniref:uncharacterized protein OsI_031781-like n=1 Tax=Triticum dicoccoides TaxID=85692 RepID=UPI00162B1D9F|nr:uncharacterized protein OsI_031781-like [Triticum dicoccoides]